MTGASSEWRTSWENLASEYARAFQENPEDVLRTICNSQVSLQCMKFLYDCFVKDKEIVTIEELEYDVKMKLFEEAKRVCIDHSKQSIISACRAIYILGLITN